MKKSLLALMFAAGLSAVAPVYAVELSGVVVPEKVVSADGALLLNGAGVRKKMMFEVYVAALYLSAKSSDAAVVLAANTPRRMQLTMLRQVDAASLYQALLDGLQANLSVNQLKELQPKIAELEKIFNEVKSVAKGDVITLDFIAGQGSKVLVRGRTAGVIEGDVFADALLSIWLGKAPVNEDLKKALLGKG
ncbi:MULTISPECIES: chalcone isomerase family protein [Deefgea]|uniref:Chalcone isomerase domain-containing protein n=1 Tax=Deefgea chitinilytica TaxID=570276 RepID=A0ABS2C8I0_9NEIS|nr:MULTISPECIES: chalcone isomerase family protein [Deefgea]MBM5570464.1 hypothetical protein [Deefgea chitinilytica]MBM9887693.1 chalcone isomerase family protein [Deefgea sp. CFH1-16]